jgi:rod shape-determining protein MreC
MTLRQTAILVALFVLTSAIMIALDHRGGLDAVRAPAEHALRPFTVAFDRAGRRIGSAGGRSDSDLQKQLDAVTAERDQLLAENARLKQLEDEVVQLQRQLAFKESRPELTVVTANILGHDPNGISSYLVIDHGSNDGIKLGMAVISPDFFVGRVTEVTPERARVTPLTEASSQVGAMLQSSNAEGVLYGRRQAGGGLELRHLDPKTSVNQGDLVVTSGRTAMIPQGLVVGRVARVNRNAQADTLSVDVAPMVDIDSLQSITIILSSNSGQ